MKILGKTGEESPESDAKSAETGDIGVFVRIVKLEIVADIVTSISSKEKPKKTPLSLIRGKISAGWKNP